MTPSPSMDEKWSILLMPKCGEKILIVSPSEEWFQAGPFRSLEETVK